MVSLEPRDPARRIIFRDCAVGLIVSADKKILLGKKDPKAGGVYADCWHLPGGGIEEGETEMQALAREMIQEVGIDITEATVELLDDSGKGESLKTLKGGEVVLCRMKFKVYRISIDRPAMEISIKPGDDIHEAVWVDPASVSNYHLTPPSVKLFNKLGYLPSTALNN